MECVINTPSDIKSTISIGVIDADLSSKSQESLNTHGLPPVWRLFGNQVAQQGGSMDFLTVGFNINDELIQNITKNKFDLLLIYIDNYIPNWMPSFLEKVYDHNPSIKLIACGYLPTVKSAEIMASLPQIHIILLGPIESALSNLSLAISRHSFSPDSLSNTYRKDYPVKPYTKEKMCLFDVNDKPADYSSGCINKEKFKNIYFKASVGVIQASIGCPMLCSFCRSSSFYHQYASNAYIQRDINDVVAEIKTLYQDYHITNFKFFDNNFLGTKRTALQRATELANTLKEFKLPITFEMHCRSDALQNDIIELLVNVGLSHVAIGIESMCESQLDRFAKKETVADHLNAVSLIKKHGITAQGYSILTDPLISRHELLENLEGLYKINESVLVLIHEKMLLYTTTPYYEQYSELIQGVKPKLSSLGTVVEYEFKDPWLQEYFPLFESTSQEFKKELQSIQKDCMPHISGYKLYHFVRMSTFYRLELLIRIANTDNPEAKEISQWKNELMNKVKRLIKLN